MIGLLVGVASFVIFCISMLGFAIFIEAVNRQLQDFDS